MMAYSSYNAIDLEVPSENTSLLAQQDANADQSTSRLAGIKAAAVSTTFAVVALLGLYSAQDYLNGVRSAMGADAATTFTVFTECAFTKPGRFPAGKTNADIMGVKLVSEKLGDDWDWHKGLDMVAAASGWAVTTDKIKAGDEYGFGVTFDGSTWIYDVGYLSGEKPQDSKGNDSPFADYKASCATENYDHYNRVFNSPGTDVKYVWGSCDTSCPLATWEGNPTKKGKRPNCPDHKFQPANKNYKWANLADCKKFCEDDPNGNCNVVVRYGGKADTEPYHCYFESCPDIDTIAWVDVTSWGNGKSTAITYVATREM